MLGSILTRAERTQDALHEFVEQSLQKNPNISYQDAVNTFWLLKISEIEEQLKLISANS